METIPLKGYWGRVLYVDLYRRESIVKPLEMDDVVSYIGGSGLAAKYLFTMTSRETDPFSPDNPLIFMTGPLTGTPAPASGRHAVVSLSPLSGIWGEANVGGSWGRELKRAGFDGIVITGASEKPAYLWINNEQIEIRDAFHLWGKDTYETDNLIRKETDLSAVVSSIGQAGENLVRVAGIFTDGSEGRAAARCGLGAVQGSKKLKAIVVKGSGRVPLFDGEALRKSVQSLRPQLREKTTLLNNFGTAGLVVPCEKLGDLPVKNWLGGSWSDGAERIGGQRMKETFKVKNSPCAGCPIGCGQRVSLKYLCNKSVDGGAPEYETLGCIGSGCLIDDLEAIAYANELCNRYGLDTIEVGNLTAMAMEAFERGMISEMDTGGVALKWGDPMALFALIEQIAFQLHLGKYLGQGIRCAAAHFGGRMSEMALESKGLSMPAHDPRAFNSTALGYATSNRGACHLQAFSHPFERNLNLPEWGIVTQDRFAVEGKGEMVAKLQDLMALFDSLSLCKFLLFGDVNTSHLWTWFNQVTGMGITWEQLLLAGERIFVLKRLYNVRLGLSRKDDTLPPRILTHRRGDGGAPDNLPPLGRMLSDYYDYRGWDETGVPTTAVLSRLDLVWAEGV